MGSLLFRRNSDFVSGSVSRRRNKRYYALAGIDISAQVAQQILLRSNGWIVAVYLPLCAFRETGAFSDAAVPPLLEKLIWDKLTAEQQTFFLRLSPCETATARQMCGLLDCNELPGYALDALASPFIRYDSAEGRYETHRILRELVTRKRAERGIVFERDCLLRAGDLCRSEGRIAEALAFYAQIQAYEQILSLDLSPVLFAEIGKSPFCEIALDTVRGSILGELGAQTRIAEWLKNGDFASLPLSPSMRNNALYVHAVFMLHQGETARFIGTLEALPAEVVARPAFSESLYWLFLALGYMATGNSARATECLERSAEKALPDGFVLSLAICSETFQGLVEELLTAKYPAHIDAFNAAKARYGIGRNALYAAVYRNELPPNLTAREREIALLAAEGMHNGEIAKILFVTESTVRTHLRTIFQKLDIDRRAKLAEKLK